LLDGEVRPPTPTRSPTSGPETDGDALASAEAIAMLDADALADTTAHIARLAARRRPADGRSRWAGA
jgi:hypothetical protein